MKASRMPLLGSAMLTAACIAPGLSQAAPQTFNTALPVSKGSFVLREQLLHRKASRGRGAMARNLEVSGAISVLGYGATSEFALFGMLPYLDKELDLATPGGQLSRNASGIGDAQVFARYTLLQRDRGGSTFRIAPFFGIKLPTGDDDNRDGVGRLPQPLQSGSGSWDPIGGVVATYQTLDYQVDAQLSYKANTEANDFQFGNEFRLDASLQYRLVPRELGDGVPGFLYGVIETNFLQQPKNEIDGLNDPDSGGTTLFLSPGLQFVTKKWIVEAIVQIPVVQNPNGAALEDEYTVRVGFRLNF